MATRKKTTSKSKKKPTQTRRKTVVRKKKAAAQIIPSEKEAKLANQKAHWDAYKKLQKQVHGAWAKLKTDINKKADPQILLRDKNRLLLLLGECNYMTLECSRLSSKPSKK